MTQETSDKFKPETPKQIATRFFEKTLKQYGVDFNGVVLEEDADKVNEASNLKDFCKYLIPDPNVKKDILTAFKNAFKNDKNTLSEISAAFAAVKFGYDDAVSELAKMTKRTGVADEAASMLHDHYRIEHNDYDRKFTRNDMDEMAKYIVECAARARFYKQLFEIIYSELSVLALAQHMPVPSLSNERKI